jgi:hypothetical protein
MEHPSQTSAVEPKALVLALAVKAMDALKEKLEHLEA